MAESKRWECTWCGEPAKPACSNPDCTMTNAGVPMRQLAGEQPWSESAARVNKTRT